MTERGQRNRGWLAASKGRAFSLIELLLVIALIGMFSTIFVVNFESLLRMSEGQAVEAAFWDASREARTRALLERRPQWLRFEEKETLFVVEEAGGGNPKTFAVDRDGWDADVKVRVAFQKKVPPNKFTLRRGQIVDVRDIAAARYFADGTCLPFQVAIEVGDVETKIEIDPWTGAQLIESDEE